MQYQVQEMLRAERIFEVEGIEDEQGADVSAGVDHTDYSYSTELRSMVRRSLAVDLA